MVSQNRSLNKLIMRISVRAEMTSPHLLSRTFVELEQISSGLQRIDHQVIYGRRGTGKTHAFHHLASQLSDDGDLAVYVDLRTIGSSGGIYSDTSLSLPQRATRLLMDVLEAVHTELLDKAIEQDVFGGLLQHLDALGDANTQVRVEGPVTLESETEGVNQREGARSLTAQLGTDPKGIHIGAGRQSRRSSSDRSRSSTQRTGIEVPRLMFGPLGRALAACAQSIEPHRIWLLLDEWSSLPSDLHPFLADLLRRSFFPCRGITVKIGAIERRSRFSIREEDGSYTGLELGADTAAALNLDEHLLATEAGANAGRFFAELLYRHVSVLMEELGRQFVIPDAEGLVAAMFERDAFNEFVRAAEGVPRDALNIVGLAAGYAGESAISVANVKHAARRYYLQDKQGGIAGNATAEAIWARIQREVVAVRRTRTFLVRGNRDHTHPGILDLYDARLIHLLRPGLESPGRPGVLYDGFA